MPGTPQEGAGWARPGDEPGRHAPQLGGPLPAGTPRGAVETVRAPKQVSVG
jgi:hypothetical protein